MPVLVVQGTTDIQAMPVDAERLSQAHPKAQLEMIDGMNHVLKEVREESAQMSSYSDPSLPVHPELIAALSDFIGILR